MHELRAASIERAKQAKRFGIIFGTLGRQGNPELLQRLTNMMKEQKREFMVVLMAEISAEVLEQYGKDVDVWVQLCCPRLSIDWGHNFVKPLLNAYEVMVALGTAEWKDGCYPMDNYSYESGPWSSYYGIMKPKTKK